MAGADERPGSPFGSYVRAVQAHRALFVAVLLAVVAGVLLWSAARSPDYTASSQIIVNAVATDDTTFIGLPVIRASGDPTRTVQTAATLLRSPQAAALTAQRLGDGWTERRVLDAVRVAPVGESDILAVSATANTPRGAAQLANAFSQATLDVRDRALRAQVRPLIDSLRVTERRLSATSTGAAADIAQRIAQLEDAERSGDPTVSLSRVATRPDSADGAPGWLMVPLAIVAGTLLASAVVLMASRALPARLQDEHEVAQVLPAPVLARVPRLSPAWHRRRRASPLALPPEVLTAFRALQVVVSLLPGEHGRILVTSPSRGDGRTTSILAFALQLAAAERHVILLDLDMRQPLLARALGVVPDTDLRAALAPGGTLADALVEVPGLPWIRVAPGFRDTSTATLEELGRRLPDLLDEALVSADIVLIDTSALGTVGDPLRFAAAADDVIVVVRQDHTEIEHLEVMRDLLTSAGITPLGYLLVGRSRRTGNGMTRYPSARAPSQAPGDTQYEAGFG
jgi:Mrp family chromosome partitioning ATPase